jgi:predicted Zn-dependent protease
MGFAGIPLVFIGGWPGLAIQRGVEVATPLAFRKHSRMAEAQADQLGLQYLYQTGYDPLAFIDFFERVAQRERSQPGLFARLLSMHPGLENRIRAAQKQIQNDLTPRPRYMIQSSEFHTVRERLAAIERGSPVPWLYRRSEGDDRPVLRRRD